MIAKEPTYIQGRMSEFIKEFRYVPFRESYTYIPHFPLVNVCSTGKTIPYNRFMSYVPFFYTIPYFYLDGE